MASTCQCGGQANTHAGDAVDERIRRAARQYVLDNCVMFDPVAVEDALDAGEPYAEAETGWLRRHGALISIPVGDSCAYPAFQFESTEAHVRPVVAEVNVALGAGDDPWGAASWWVSPHARLANATPQSLIGTDRESDLLVLAAAMTSHCTSQGQGAAAHDPMCFTPEHDVQPGTCAGCRRVYDIRQDAFDTAIAAVDGIASDYSDIVVLPPLGVLCAVKTAIEAEAGRILP